MKRASGAWGTLIKDLTCHQSLKKQRKIWTLRNNDCNVPMAKDTSLQIQEADRTQTIKTQNNSHADTS